MSFGKILFLLFLIIVWYIIKFISLIYHFKDIAEKPFLCPNCGEEFYVSWARLMFLPNFPLAFKKEMRLKCPHCKKRGMCKWQSEEDF